MLTGKVAVVTGASRGIGREIAVTLASKGAIVIVNYNGSGARAEEVVKEIEAAGGKAESIQCNVSDFEKASELISYVIKQYGRVDILVNNAGISYVGLLTEMEPEAWERVIRTNLTAVFLCSKFGTKQMLRKKRGKIINISSVWGAVGASCEAAYSASKGGVNAFTRALGKELAPSNIQVNAIACGIIDTDMNRCFSEEERYALKEEVPAGRFGSPEEIARVALSLVEAPSYLTGQIITVDGGWI